MPLKIDAAEVTVTLLSETITLFTTEVFVLDDGIVAVEADAPLLPLIVILTGEVAAFVIIIVNCCATLVPAGLVAVTLKVYTPTVVGYPLIEPVLALNTSPAGILPEVTLHVVGEFIADRF